MMLLRRSLRHLAARPRLELQAGIPAGRFRARLLTHNLPFLVGALLLLGLLGLALFGPRLASQNPYLSSQRSAELVNGELVYPPFAPSAEFPLGSDAWGRDLLSLLLYGARNTLVACLFVTMVRLILGLGLGALAGWQNGRLADRLVMGLVEILASLPLLLTGVILILALDIRRGLVAFLIALSLVGWGEIAQYLRGELIALKERAFVEGARVVGLSEAGIVVRHMLPNILPQLVILALLETGAVLMLLGELGFVGVFIGGGLAQTNAQDQTILIADIPEWGAILASARNYLRSAPWMVFYPAMAFFIAVLGFNLLGEGLRRIIREAGINTAALVSKRMLLVVVVISLLTAYIVNQIGPGVSYAKLALQFDGAGALAHARQIAALQQDDPGFGTDGARRAAEYIATQFEANGAQPAGAGQRYLQPVTRQIVRRLSTPELRITPEGGGATLDLIHGADFGEQIYRHGGSGQGEGPLVFVAFGRGELDYAAYRGLNLESQVVLVLGENAPAAFDTEALIRGARAVLIVREDTAPRLDVAQDCLEKPTLPILHLHPAAAERMLQATGQSLAGLRAQAEALQRTQPAQRWAVTPLGLRAQVKVELSEPETLTGYNVLAVLPGNDTALDEQGLLLSTAYDLPEPDPGQPFLAAGNGPAGVGVMLEMLRLWRAEDFKPRRTVLFAAWAGGYLTQPGAATYREEPSPYKSMPINATLHLGAVGSGGPALLVDGDETPLQRLLVRSSQVAELEMRVAALPAPANARFLGGDSAVLGWEAAPDPFRREDTLSRLDAQRLAQLGQVVNLALITASRQYHY